jgi:MOSC domain-containing protein YiiM
MIRVVHLFVSPGHNFFGHHGQPPDRHPLAEVSAVECVTGQGLRGDRFFGHREDYKGQITFFSSEVFAALQAALGLSAGLSPGATRRNVITEGVDLNTLVGTEFEVQGVRFTGTAECAPCHWMDTALGPGAEAWLKGRGGLRARILSDGWLRCDA